MFEGDYNDLGFRPATRCFQTDGIYHVPDYIEKLGKINSRNYFYEKEVVSYEGLM